MNARVGRPGGAVVLTVCAILALPALSGCAALVVGAVAGAAVGGYYMGKDERPAAVIASDGRITAAVKSRLIGDPYVEGLRIGVETYEGVVTLTGDVTSSVPKEQAERLATAVDGVKSVRNEIRIVRPTE